MALAAEGDGAAEPGDDAVELGDAAELREEVGAALGGRAEASPEGHPDRGSGAHRQRRIEGDPDGLADDLGPRRPAVDPDAEAFERAQPRCHGVELEAVDGLKARVQDRDVRGEPQPSCVPVEMEARAVFGLQSVAGDGRNGCLGRDRRGGGGRAREWRAINEHARDDEGRQDERQLNSEDHAATVAGTDRERAQHRPRPGALRVATHALSVHGSVSPRMTSSALVQHHLATTTNTWTRPLTLHGGV